MLWYGLDAAVSRSRQKAMSLRFMAVAAEPLRRVSKKLRRHSMQRRHGSELPAALTGRVGSTSPRIDTRACTSSERL
jgi:hypothetical protein